jgi:hypothetical protein
MMEAARTSETSVDNYFTWQYIPEDKSELQKYSKSPTYAVNCFRWFLRKLKNRVSRTVLKYDVFLT